MVDPLGLAGSQGASPVNPAGASRAQKAPGDGPSFKDALLDNLREVNKLQQDATEAIEDLQTGKRDDIETVLMATQKADTAFRMLLATRNKVMEAYREISQIRV